MFNPVLFAVSVGGCAVSSFMVEPSYTHFPSHATASGNSGLALGGPSMIGLKNGARKETPMSSEFCVHIILSATAAAFVVMPV